MTKYYSLEQIKSAVKITHEKYGGMTEEFDLFKLLQMPSADVVPVKHGKWIYYDDGGMRYDEYRCSVCGKRFTVDAERIDDICFVIDDLKYCPNCGADMREG